jgi:uncharacterized repeat protein (TIGR01451 family)
MLSFDRLFSAMLRLFALCCAALLAIQPASAQSTTIYSNSTDSATDGISDTLTPCTNRFTRTFAVGSSYTVTDVNVGVLMAHTYRGDLNMYLVSPAGTRVQIVNRVGAAADNFNALLDDEAASAVSNYTANAAATAGTGVPPYADTFIPSAALTAFDGQNSSGTWTLEICDAAAQDTGTFFQADLYLSQAPTNYADLSLTKSVSDAAPTAGAAISYTLTIANAATSPLTANSVVVRDLLPSGATFVSYSGNGTYDPASGDWAVGTLAPGATKTLTINVTVAATSGATVTNTAEIYSSSVVDSDSTPNNGANGEDDYAARSFTVSGARIAGTAPTLICPIGSTVFDWDGQTWAAGSTSNSYTVTGFGSIGFALVNPGAWLNNATYGGQSPTRQNVITGGLVPAQYSLMELVDLVSQSDTVSTTITLPVAVSGVQFTVFDVDYTAGQFADKITVTGTYNGASVTPTLTNGVANYVIGNTAYGDATSADTQANGNVVVTFASAVDTIVIRYGNHALAPANPGQQGIQIHDIKLCNPQANVTVSKASTIISDPVNGTTNPYAIPGAVTEYCILVTNAGTATITNLTGNDVLPTNVTYVAGSMTSGSSCAAATTVEDDDAIGADEADPNGASIVGRTISIAAGNLPSGSSVALKLRATVN